MKKVLMGMAVMSCVALAGEGTNLYLSTGVDISGKFEKMYYQNGDVNLNKSQNDKGGFELNIEGTKEFYPNLELGLGLSYQDHGKPEKYSVTKQGYGNYIFENTGYKSLPLYAIIKYNIPVESNIKPYLKANLGYSFNFDEKDLKAAGKGAQGGSSIQLKNSKVSLDNGLYYGIGGGIEYNNFIVELMYKVNKADSEIRMFDGTEKVKGNYDYSRTTLAFGYRFNF